MKLKTRLGLFFVAVGLLAGLAGWLTVRFFLFRPEALPEVLPEIARNLEFELDNVRYTHTRAGVKKWELSTDKARRIKGRDEIELIGVKARIYAEGKLDSDTLITAAAGAYKVDSGDMTLSGKVLIVNPEFEIRTARLAYHEATEQISAPERLFLESEKLKIAADQARIDLPRGLLTMQGRVEARLWPVSPSASQPEKPVGAVTASPMSVAGAALGPEKVKPPETTIPVPAPAKSVLESEVPSAAPVSSPEVAKVIRSPAGIKGKRKLRPQVQIEKISR